MSERKALADWMRRWSNDLINEVVAEKLHRAADLLDPPARGRTKRVRIAVAMTAAERFCAAAHSDDDDAKSRAVAEEGVWGSGDPDPIRVSFVEALVPLPEETTVEGEVS